MAFRCAVCGKGAQAAHKVSHSNRKARKWQEPNLQRVHALLNGTPGHTLACTRCIRSGKIVKAA
jgi:large subunit ribosomal protein L28